MTSTSSGFLDRSPWLLAACFGFINVAVFGLQIVSGVPLLEPTPADLLAWGGNAAPLTLNGDAWRLLTSMFLHVGLLHLLANMYMLALVGPVAAARYGAAGFAIIYLGGGLVGSIVSTWWSAQNLFTTVQVRGPFGLGQQVEQIRLIVSVGASGAIMAVCGALAAIWLGTAGRTEHSEDDDKFHKGLLQTIGLNVALGFMIPGIDQAAHLGGLVGGWVLGSIAGLAGTGQALAVRALRVMAAWVVAAVVVGVGLGVANTEKITEAAERLRAEASER